MKPINKKHLIIGSAISGFALICSILSFINFANAKSSDDLSKNWMSKIEDSKYISEISMPGSHDSGALYSIADLAGKCQDVSIKKQLEFGGRFLDIRLKYNKNKFSVIHGIVDERDSFDNVLNSCKQFLKENPSETIVMSIKNEDGNNREEFTSSLEDNYIKKDEIFFYEENIPTLGEVRGKIILLSRYDNASLGFKVNEEWKDNVTFDANSSLSLFHIQDHYKLDTLEEKWEEAKECFEFADANILPNVYTINFLSGYLNSGFPPSYSVPVAKYMNNQILNNLGDYDKVGTVLFDFLSEELAKTIYGRNF